MTCPNRMAEIFWRLGLNNRWKKQKVFLCDW